MEIDGINIGSFIRDTLRVDKNLSPEEAVEIYKVLRPGEPPNLETAFEVFIHYSLNQENMTFLM